MQNIDSVLPAMVGGLASTITASYFGYDNPVIGILGASVGASILNKVQKFYFENKEYLPGVSNLIKFQNLLTRKSGLDFNTLIITKDDFFIYKKLQTYIFENYKHCVSSTGISSQENNSVEFNLRYSNFKTPIVEFYESKKVFICPKKEEIHIKSNQLNIFELKNFIKSISNNTNKKIVIHQACEIINYQTSYKTNSAIQWNTINTLTNKNFKNTIFSSYIQNELINDIAKFINSEKYYNEKGLPYQRGYFFVGPPGTGKTSLIKAIASEYNMEIFNIDFRLLNYPENVQNIFNHIQNTSGYHIVCIEDINKDIPRDIYSSILNKFDGITENSYRILILTSNDYGIKEKYPALFRPGRIDKEIMFDYCDAEQIQKIYNYFANNNYDLQIHNPVSVKRTGAEIINYILKNQDISPENFKKDIFSNIQLIENDVIVSPKKTLLTPLRDLKTINNAYRKFMFKFKKVDKEIQKILKKQEKQKPKNKKGKAK